MKTIQTVQAAEPKFDPNSIDDLLGNYVTEGEDPQEFNRFEKANRSALVRLSHQVEIGQAAISFYHYMTVTLQKLHDRIIIYMDQTDGLTEVTPQELYTYVVIFAVLNSEGTNMPEPSRMLDGKNLRDAEREYREQFGRRKRKQE